MSSSSQVILQTSKTCSHTFISLSFYRCGCHVPNRQWKNSCFCYSNAPEIEKKRGLGNTGINNRSYERVGYADF